MENHFYGHIDGLTKPVSRILYGTAIPPINQGAECGELLDQIFACGINTFDCARNYDKAEASLGKWISSRDNREKVVILSKCGHPDSDGKKRVNEKEMRKDLEKSLSELQTDYIDIYLLHRDDPEASLQVVMETFNSMAADGKIRVFGASNWTHHRIEEANEYAYAHNLQPMRVTSPNFGLAEQVADPWGGGCITISGKEGKSAREWYQNNQMPIIAYSSLGRGLLSGKLKSSAIKSEVEKVLDVYARIGYYSEQNMKRLKRCEEIAQAKGVTVPQIAMSWIFRQSLNMYAVVSTTSPERMKQNIDAFHLELTLEECRYINLENQ